MADTPRGPRPTVTRRTAFRYAAAWVTVAALVVAAAILPLTMLESGWSRERVAIVESPYGSCDDDGCRIRPLVELPSGKRVSVPLTIVEESELLPSNHFRAGGSLLLWIHDDHAPRSLRPMTANGTLATRIVLVLAITLGVGLLANTPRLHKLHHPSRAGHVFDHVALRILPAVVLLLALVLLWWALHRTTPRHDPLLPKQPVHDASRGS